MQTEVEVEGVVEVKEEVEVEEVAGRAF